MKARLITFGLLIVSSLFLSNMPNNKENDSIEKTDNIKVESLVTSRTPIIIVKRD